MKNTPDDEIVYNPDSDDFLVTYDLKGDGRPDPYIIHAKEAAKFPPVIANHIKKHLANRLVMKRGIKLNYEADYEKAYIEISTLPKVL